MVKCILGMYPPVVKHGRYDVSVKHSLLAILSEGPAYGYQLKSQFEARTGSTWPLNIGQVYTTLDRLTRDGLATAVGVDEDDRPLYEITGAGRSELSSWFLRPVANLQPPPRSELAIKLALALRADVDMDAVVQGQRTATMASLQHYTLAKRQADPDDVAWLMVIDLMILSAEAELHWLDQCEQHLRRRRTKPTPPDRSRSLTRGGAPVPGARRG